MNWMDKFSQADENVTIERHKISRLLFANNLVLMSSSKSGLQHAFKGFAIACDITGMKISTFTTEVLHLSRNLDLCYLQVGGVSLKQTEMLKILEIAFTSDGRQDKKLDARSGKANAVM